MYFMDDSSTHFHDKVFFHFLKINGKKWRKILSWKFMDKSSINYLWICKWGKWIGPKSWCTNLGSHEYCPKQKQSYSLLDNTHICLNTYLIFSPEESINWGKQYNFIKLHFFQIFEQCVLPASCSNGMWATICVKSRGQHLRRLSNFKLLWS